MYSFSKLKIDIDDMIKNDPVFPKYLDSYVPQDVEGDPLKRAFRKTIELDTPSYDPKEFHPRNEEEAKSGRLYDYLRKKYFDLKFESHAVKQFEVLREEF